MHRIRTIALAFGLFAGLVLAASVLAFGALLGALVAARAHDRLEPVTPADTDVMT